MLRKTVVGAILLLVILTVVACASPDSTPASTATQEATPNPKPSGPIKATWIETQADGDTVYTPVSEVEDNWNTNFKLDTQGGSINFMAYVVDGEIFVRSNVCPPCGSVGFSLDDDILICDRCATTFKAKTGDGIKGACVDFHKASVPYEITDGDIVMSTDDLLAAHENTIKPGWP